MILIAKSIKNINSTIITIFWFCSSKLRNKNSPKVADFYPIVLMKNRSEIEKKKKTYHYRKYPNPSVDRLILQEPLVKKEKMLPHLNSKAFALTRRLGIVFHPITLSLTDIPLLASRYSSVNFMGDVQSMNILCFHQPRHSEIEPVRLRNMSWLLLHLYSIGKAYVKLR